MIEQDLRTALLAHAPLTSIVGQNIAALVVPEAATSPYVTYQVVVDVSNQCLQGNVYQNSTRLQIDCWSTSYANVKAIKEAVINSLVGFKKSYNINVMDGYESETLLYRQIIDFNLKG
jgi:hypothetical protein